MPKPEDEYEVRGAVSAVNPFAAQEEARRRAVEDARLAQIREAEQLEKRARDLETAARREQARLEKEQRLAEKTRQRAIEHQQLTEQEERERRQRANDAQQVRQRAEEEQLQLQQQQQQQMQMQQQQQQRAEQNRVDSERKARRQSKEDAERRRIQQFEDAERTAEARSRKIRDQLAAGKATGVIVKSSTEEAAEAQKKKDAPLAIYNFDNATSGSLMSNLRDSTLRLETLEHLWNYVSVIITQSGLSGLRDIVDSGKLDIDLVAAVPAIATTAREHPANLPALCLLGVLAFSGHKNLAAAVGAETVIPSIRDKWMGWVIVTRILVEYTVWSEKPHLHRTSSLQLRAEKNRPIVPDMPTLPSEERMVSAQLTRIKQAGADRLSSLMQCYKGTKWSKNLPGSAQADIMAKFDTMAHTMQAVCSDIEKFLGKQEGLMEEDDDDEDPAQKEMQTSKRVAEVLQREIKMMEDSLVESKSNEERWKKELAKLENLYAEQEKQYD